MQHHFKVGRAYKITFLDHVKDSNKPVTCSCYGVVVDDFEKYVVIAYWVTEHEDEEVQIQNREVLSLLKSTIKKKKLID